MKLIVGLGNPGIEYQFTPHNAGFLAIDRMADDCGVQVVNRRGRALTGADRRNAIGKKPGAPSVGADRFTPVPGFALDRAQALPFAQELENAFGLRIG